MAVNSSGGASDRSMDRRRFLGTMGSAMGACLLPWDMGTWFGEKRRKPNVVYILADDMGYGELSSYGGEIPTPNIDSIGTNGVRFTNGYVTCPVCSPTRAGLITGRYQQRFGHEFNVGEEGYQNAGFGLPLSEKTFADRMKTLGYATGCFGKWHLGVQPEMHPMKRGFDEFYGFLGGAHNYMEVKGGVYNSILRGYDEVEKIDYATDAFTREAVSFIESHANEPFFVYLPYNAIHSPFEAPEKYLSRFASIENPKHRKLAAMLSAMDDGVGKVLKTLREHGLEEDTLVIFHSDNGAPDRDFYSNNGPLRGYKSQVYEGGVRIPFMIQWKGRIKPGQVSDDMVLSLDMLPTAVNLAGGKVSPDWNLEGVDLMPYLKGETDVSPHEVLCWRQGPRWAVRKGDWKLVHQELKEPPALYNLKEDLGETKDLSQSRPDKVKELQKTYDTWNSGNVEPLWRGKDKFYR